MAVDQLQVEDLLAQIHLFQGFDEAALRNLAERLEPVHIRQGTSLFSEGDAGDSLYIVFRGQLRVDRQVSGRRKTLGILGPGDYFGEEALLYERPRSASIAALTPADLLRMDAELFADLVAGQPKFQANLLATAESRQLARRMNFDWLGEGEVIHLVARKHPARLWLSLVGPVVVGLFGLPFIALVYITAIITPLILGVLLLLIAFTWGIWNAIDWGNDYYIVTSLRVVWLERVIWLYDSRQEAPLRTVLSVSVESDQIGRILGYGDIIVRTYTGRIVMRNVGRPQQLASLVEQYWLRSRRQSQEAESDAIEGALRQRLGLPAKEPPAAPQAAPPAGAEPEPQDELEPEGEQAGFLDLLFANFFKLRYQEGSIITYRKHWYLLLQKIWLSTLLILGTLAFMSARLLGSLEFLSPTTVLVVGIATLTILAAWWLYDFIDWRNDIYQVTADHIVDIDRKPLGTEQKKSAPLENILSLDYEREGLLGLLLNFGNVIIRIGGSEFTFDGVHDPAQVQQDVFGHMDERLRQKREAEAARERDRMAEWLATYHRNFEDYRESEEAQYPDEDLG